MAERSKSGEVRAINIEPMGPGEGVISHTEMKFKRSGQGGGPSMDYETERHHHPTMEDLHSHIESRMGKCFSEKEKDGPEHEPAD